MVAHGVEPGMRRAGNKGELPLPQGTDVFCRQCHVLSVVRQGAWRGSSSERQATRVTDADEVPWFWDLETSSGHPTKAWGAPSTPGTGSGCQELFPSALITATTLFSVFTCDAKAVGFRLLTGFSHLSKNWGTKLNTFWQTSEFTEL